MPLLDRSAFAEELTVIIEAVIEDRLDRAAFGRIEPHEVEDLVGWLNGARDGIDVAVRRDGRLHLTQAGRNTSIVLGDSKEP